MPLHEYNVKVPSAGHSPAVARDQCMPPDELSFMFNCDTWPPFLPGFTEDVSRAVEAFVALFLSRIIAFRCGQLRDGGGFVGIFLAQWLNAAFDRQRALDRMLDSCAARLTDAEVRLLDVSRNRLQSAIRDAEREMVRHRVGEPEKTVSFTRPLAYRVARRSHDRLLVRSLPHSDDGGREGDGRRDAESCEHQRLEFVALDEGAESAEEPFTGRASGVFYGNVFHADRLRETVTVEGDEARQPRASYEHVAGFAVRRKRRSTVRRLWLLLTYWAVPMTLVVLSYVYARRASRTPM